MLVLIPIIYLLLIGLIGVVSWTSRKHMRVRFRTWFIFVLVSLLSGPLLWLSMWMTRFFTHTSNHPLYLLLIVLFLLPYLIAIALLKKRSSMVFMALGFLGVLILCLYFGFGGSCAVFNECL